MGRIVGIRAIQNYLGKSESTVMDMINHSGLPAEKKEGVWEVDQAALDRWNSPDPGEKRGVDKPEKAVSIKTVESKPEKKRFRTIKKSRKGYK